ncbi:hypothetical protein [Actinomadura sp. NTSP31]|uniref:hypothetical protein n=1 Tax=Actinomadura sp. NTSP31 TaxID=1735447 RepID=UPI0035C1237E
MARTELPDDVQAETRRRRRRWLALLAVLLVAALALASPQYQLARLLGAAAALWSVAGLAWVNMPAMDFRRTEARIRAEEHIRGRQE